MSLSPSKATKNNLESLETLRVRTVYLAIAGTNSQNARHTRPASGARYRAITNISEAASAGPGDSGSFMYAQQVEVFGVLVGEFEE